MLTDGRTVHADVAGKHVCMDVSMKNKKKTGVTKREQEQLTCISYKGVTKASHYLQK